MSLTPQNPFDGHTLEALSSLEAKYASKARAANTLRGYRSDWADWSTWCADHGHTPLPAAPVALSRYLTDLAEAGASVGTMARRKSALRLAHQLRGLADPSTSPRVRLVWEGIVREHGAPPAQALPLMPPLLWDVLDACPTTKTWKTKGRDPEPSLGGARDRALLLVGFVTALRPSELVALDWEDLRPDARGYSAGMTRSKTNQTGKLEVVVIPHGSSPLPTRCPVTALDAWRDALPENLRTGPLLRSVNKGNRPGGRLSVDAVTTLVKAAVQRAGVPAADVEHYSARSLRSGFVTYARERGIPSEDIARQTRHRSLATLGIYTRHLDAWTRNAATRLL